MRGMVVLEARQEQQEETGEQGQRVGQGRGTKCTVIGQLKYLEERILSVLITEMITEMIII